MNVLPWFRLYWEARTDNKLALLTDAEHRVWFNLMCLSAESHPRGTTPPMGDCKLAAEVARGRIALLLSTLAKLAPDPQGLDIAERLPDGSVRFIHWRGRQYEHPSDTPEEVAKRVAKHRGAACNDPVTTCNDPETPGNDLTLRATEYRVQSTEESKVKDSCSPAANDAAAERPHDDAAQRPTPKGAEPEDFAAFYQAYPRHVARPAAVSAWRRLPKKDRLAVMAALSSDLFAEADPQFIPHPATFLNQRRWEDDRPSRNGKRPDPAAEVDLDTLGPETRAMLERVGAIPTRTEGDHDAA